MNYVNELQKIFDITKYRSVNIEKVRGGFFALGNKYTTLNNAKAAIDISYSSLNKSIK